jgi:hypothetical protein
MCSSQTRVTDEGDERSHFAQEGMRLRFTQDVKRRRKDEEENL